MRVPMLAYCPEIIKPGTVIKDVVANIDIAPRLLEAAGFKAPAYMDGKSFMQQLLGKSIAWLNGLLYEHYWERNYSQNTHHACRTWHISLLSTSTSWHIWQNITKKIIRTE